MLYLFIFPTYGDNNKNICEKKIIVEVRRQMRTDKKTSLLNI